jgi:hypothetical protein
MSNHDKIVSALTNWDALQSQKDRYHNWRFLGIALQSLASVEEDMPNESAENIAKEAFNGRCLTYVLKYLEKNK